LGLVLRILGILSGNVCCMNTAPAAVAVWDEAPAAVVLLPLGCSAEGHDDMCVTVENNCCVLVVLTAVQAQNICR
jgi:hypothetical protein